MIVLKKVIVLTAASILSSTRTCSASWGRTWASSATLTRCFARHSSSWWCRRRWWPGCRTCGRSRRWGRTCRPSRRRTGAPVCERGSWIASRNPSRNPRLRIEEGWYDMVFGAFTFTGWPVTLSPIFLLTSKQKLRFGIDSWYRNETLFWYQWKMGLNVTGHPVHRCPN